MSLVFICAHPDDEAYGPAGTLAKLAEHKDVYLICVTNGNDKTRVYTEDIKESGLSNIRHIELETSASVLSIKKVFYLGYEDGNLSNNIYHEVAEKIETILKEVGATTIMTYENRGVSGHIDHIFVSMVCTYIFKRNQDLKELHYYCLDEKERELIGEDYFVYFPQGYKDSEIDKVVDVSDVWDKKVAAVKAHPSQIEDEAEIEEWLEKGTKKEHFIVLKK